MNEVATPSRFDKLEAEIAKLPALQLEIVHHWAPGLYAREMRIPAGTALTGRIHKKECLNIVLGDITVYNDSTGVSKRITGYATFRSPAGTRRAGFAHQATVWTCFHVTDKTDLAEIEAEFIEHYENPLLMNSKTEVLQ